MKLSNSYFLCFVLVTLSITNIFSQYKNGKYTFESLNKDASQRAILSIAQDHKEKSPAVIAERAPAKLLYFHHVMTVPGNEKFRSIGEADNQTGEYNGFGHIF